MSSELSTDEFHRLVPALGAAKTENRRVASSGAVDGVAQLNLPGACRCITNRMAILPFHTVHQHRIE
jgi:hypothetical protein